MELEQTPTLPVAPSATPLTTTAPATETTSAQATETTSSEAKGEIGKGMQVTLKVKGMEVNLTNERLGVDAILPLGSLLQEVDVDDLTTFKAFMSIPKADRKVIASLLQSRQAAELSQEFSLRMVHALLPSEPAETAASIVTNGHKLVNQYVRSVCSTLGVMLENTVAFTKADVVTMAIQQRALDNLIPVWANTCPPAITRLIKNLQLNWIPRHYNDIDRAEVTPRAPYSKWLGETMTIRSFLTTFADKPTFVCRSDPRNPRRAFILNTNSYVECDEDDEWVYVFVRNEDDGEEEAEAEYPSIPVNVVWGDLLEGSLRTKRSSPAHFGGASKRTKV